MKEASKKDFLYGLARKKLSLNLHDNYFVEVAEKAMLSGDEPQEIFAKIMAYENEDFIKYEKIIFEMLKKFNLKIEDEISASWIYLQEVVEKIINNVCSPINGCLEIKEFIGLGDRSDMFDCNGFIYLYGYGICEQPNNDEEAKALREKYGEKHSIYQYSGEKYTRHLGEEIVKESKRWLIENKRHLI